MFPTHTDWQVHQAHYKELLRIAEQERLARAAIRTQLERQSLWRKAAEVIGAQLPRWVWKQQPACDTQPSLTARETATEPCC